MKHSFFMLIQRTVNRKLIQLRQLTDVVIKENNVLSTYLKQKISREEKINLLKDFLSIRYVQKIINSKLINNIFKDRMEEMRAFQSVPF